MKIDLNLSKEQIESFTVIQKDIYFYITNNPEIVAYSTVLDVAGDIGVSTASIVRFCQKINFNGYKDLQEFINKIIVSKLSLPIKFEKNIIKNKYKKSDNSVVLNTMNNSINNIVETYENLDSGIINKVVKEIILSKKIYVFGLRESYALAHYMYTRLITIFPKVQILNGEGSLLFPENLNSIEENSMIIFFLFPRYTKLSISLIEELNKLESIKILLFSSINDPSIEKMVDYRIISSIKSLSHKNCQVATISLIDTLVTLIALESEENSLEYVKKLENLLKLSL
ncbi:MurR/RpiR family transcriptional regulator [Peptoniphilus catoniae]|uniref:MurR/RpiR family transcriptional regulator n=1 Tax=Peptoniphilus catoniae TaxID=1660341 RepID=UPI0010FD927C|nr:MurR/RpiR family transcriptional regulator [Peptoniphilus catoniae]